MAAIPPLNSHTVPVATDTVASAVPLPYFEVGLGKFVAMSIATWGFYDLYWAYQQWTRIKTRTSEDLSPFWRAFFAHLWGFSLFKRIRTDAIAQGVSVDWDSGFLGIVYLIVVALWRLPDPWWLISLLAFLPLIPVVKAVAAIHDKVAEHRDQNARFSEANIAGLVLGGILWFLVIVGLSSENP